MSVENEEFPSELIKILKDFITDVQNTFPEYVELFTKNELEYLNDNPNVILLNKSVEYFKTVYPERFFDILYENEEMFLNHEINTKFFENIDFKHIWNSNISDNTKKIIWKYLQLVLFSLSNNIEGIESFGETAKLFEAIDENELKSKLEEVISSMGNIFDLSNSDLNENFKEFNDFMKNYVNENDVDISNVNFDDIFKQFEELNENLDISENEFKNFFDNFMSGKNGENIFDDENLPDPNDIHNHLTSIMDGKIGKLAQEIADETAKELDIDTDNISNVGDVFSKLFKNPGKLTNMIKKVSTKLDEKLKSGEIKKSELMKEANEIMSKLQATPGMKGMEKMFSKMGMGGLGGKNTKLNMNLFKSMMQRNQKQCSQKERMLRKLEKRKMEKELTKMQAQNSKPTEKEQKEYDEYIQKTYKLDNTKMEKSKIRKKKKKKKGKKNKK